MPSIYRPLKFHAHPSEIFEVVVVVVVVHLYSASRSASNALKKVKEVDFYSAFIEVPYTQGAQVCAFMHSQAQGHSNENVTFLQCPKYVNTYFGHLVEHAYALSTSETLTQSQYVVT